MRLSLTSQLYELAIASVATSRILTKILSERSAMEEERRIVPRCSRAALERPDDRYSIVHRLRFSFVSRQRYAAASSVRLIST